MTTYHHPASFRPPLALGGHCWTFTGAGFDWFTCVGCFVTVPRWALAEGFWRNFAGSYCLGAVRALPSGCGPGCAQRVEISSLGEIRRRYVCEVHGWAEP